jgi:hypothetical protein
MVSNAAVEASTESLTEIETVLEFFLDLGNLLNIFATSPQRLTSLIQKNP